MYKKKAGNKIKIYGKGYLVKSVFSDQHFSYNTIDYYNKLQQVSKPWYYVFYDYTLCNECYINRINLKKIYFDTEVNVDDGVFYLFNLSINSKKDLDNNNLLNDDMLNYEIKNLQQLTKVIRDTFK